MKMMKMKKWNEDVDSSFVGCTIPLCVWDQQWEQFGDMKSKYFLPPKLYHLLLLGYMLTCIVIIKLFPLISR